jgi:aromatic-L-amino-acid decarboxylase
LHVDGAYGLIGNASPQVAPLLEGVADADSWTVDPHKWLATGVGVGAVFVRDGALLTRAFAEGHADYLEGSFSNGDEPVSEFDGLGGDWADQGVELSAPPRGALVWAVLREIGRRGVGERVDRHIALAQHFADRVRRHPELELLCEPVLSIVCYRYHPRPEVGIDALNAELLVALRRSTATVPSSTVIDGKFALRPCFINPRTTQHDVDALIENTVEIGRQILATTRGQRNTSTP